MILAGRAAGREALRLSGNTEFIPEDARRIEGVLAAASPFRTALPTSNLHSVGVEHTLASIRFSFFFFFGCVFAHRRISHDGYSLPESSIAPYLTELQKRVKEEGIRVGSYPLLMKGVFVSLIGQNEGRVRELGREVEGQTQGKAVTEQEVRETKGIVSL